MRRAQVFPSPPPSESAKGLSTAALQLGKNKNAFVVVGDE